MKNVGETAGLGSVLPSLASWLLGWPGGRRLCCPRPLSPQTGVAFRPVCWLKPTPPATFRTGIEGVPPIPRLGNYGWDSWGPGSGDGLGEAGSVFFPARGGGGPTSKAPRGLCCFTHQGPWICSGWFHGGARDHSVSFGNIILSQMELSCPRSSAPFWPCSERLAGACAHSPPQTSLVPVNKGAGAGLWVREDLGQGAALPCLLVMPASFWT